MDWRAKGQLLARMSAKLTALGLGTRFDLLRRALGLGKRTKTTREARRRRIARRRRRSEIARASRRVNMRISRGLGRCRA